MAAVTFLTGKFQSSLCDSERILEVVARLTGKLCQLLVLSFQLLFVVALSSRILQDFRKPGELPRRVKESSECEIRSEPTAIFVDTPPSTCYLSLGFSAVEQPLRSSIFDCFIRKEGLVVRSPDFVSRIALDLFGSSIPRADTSL